MASDVQRSPSLFISAEKSPPDSLVVLLHGSGGDSESLRCVAESLAPELPTTAFLLPSSPVPEGAPSAQWYVLDSETKELKGLEVPTSEILGSIESFRREHGVSMNRVAFLGHSMGSSMAGLLALQLPETCMGLVLLSGSPPWKLLNISDAGRRTPVLFCAGSKDKLVPMERNRRACDALRSLGLEVVFKEFPNQGHDISGAEATFVGSHLRGWLSPVTFRDAPPVAGTSTAGQRSSGAALGASARSSPAARKSSDSQHLRRPPSAAQQTAKRVSQSSPRFGQPASGATSGPTPMSSGRVSARRRSPSPPAAGVPENRTSEPRRRSPSPPVSPPSRAAGRPRAEQQTSAGYPKAARSPGPGGRRNQTAAMGKRAASLPTRKTPQTVEARRNAAAAAAERRAAEEARTSVETMVATMETMATMA